MRHPPEALRSAKLFDCGCGYLVVSRFKADGRVEAGFFLLDMFCLGVKDAGFHRFDSVADYQESLLDRLFPDEDAVRMTPAAARKLTEDAISYARGLGFSPGADYKKASRVFGGITTADCDEQFLFGKDDKPLYIQGPSDSPARVERILRALEVRCGEGGYHYIVAADDFEPFEGEEENGESAITDPVGRTGLAAMAAGLRASRPGMEIRINPPGRRKSFRHDLAGGRTAAGVRTGLRVEGNDPQPHGAGLEFHPARRDCAGRDARENSRSVPMP
jgi:hypothetical protein